MEELGKSLEVVCCLDGGPRIKIKMKNIGDQIIKKNDWAIFMYSMHMLRVSVRDANLFKVTHVAGSLFRLDPSTGFYDMAPASSLELQLLCDDNMTKRCFMFPNWYVANNSDYGVLESTTTMSYVKYQDEKGDEIINQSNASVENLFECNAIHVSSEEDNNAYVEDFTPTPCHKNFANHGSVPVQLENWSAIGDISQPDILFEMFKISTGFENKTPSKNFIKFSKCESIADEGYEINIDAANSSITIGYGSAAGEFYALQTLRRSIGKNSFITSGCIKDAPSFSYRGLHIDVARNFHSCETICRIIKVMAAYKLNRLHLHLTDDEGWRINIDGLPELTDVGGHRSHFGKHLKPQLGSGPSDNSSGSGYYSNEDYIKILLEAKKHHIVVIPEIDMPGHCYAAIKSMEVRYENFARDGDMEKAVEFLPIDKYDILNVESVQMYAENTLNPCLEGTWRFVEHVIKQVKKLHEGIQPLEMFHIGGDEVPEGVWDSSNMCKKAFSNSTSLSKDVEGYFVRKAGALCRSLGLKMAIWADGLPNDGAYDKEESPDISVAWRISQKNEKYNPYKLANEGHKVIVASASHVYFDIVHEPDFEEQGLTWATQSINTRKVFLMKPLDMYDCFQKTEAEHEKLIKTENIIGVQAEVWSETITTEEQLHKMLFPRLIAFSERAWNNVLVLNHNKIAWKKFASNLVSNELLFLEDLNIKYRLPKPVISIQNDQVQCHCEFPGLKVLYKKFGTDKWNELDGKNQDIKKFEMGVKYSFVTLTQGQDSCTSQPTEIYLPIK